MTRAAPNARELALLVAATARPASEDHTAMVATAAIANRVDWPRFVKLVERHRVAPLAFDGLKPIRASIPNDIGQALRAGALRDRAKALQQARLLMTITALLAEAGIAATALKGPVLAQLAFGDLSARHCSDIDILIDASQVTCALATLGDANFQIVKPRGFENPDCTALWMQRIKDVSLVHEPTGIIVELHWRLNENPFLYEARSGCSQTVRVGTADIATLTAEDLLLYLCVHGAHHAWFRLKWLTDVYALVQTDGTDLSKFDDRACQQGLHVPAGAMLILLHEVFGLALSDALIARARRSRRARWLAGLSRHFLLDGEEGFDARFSGMAMTGASLLLRADRRYLAREIGHLIVDWSIVSRLGGTRWAHAMGVIGRPASVLARKLRLSRGNLRLGGA